MDATSLPQNDDSCSNAATNSGNDLPETSELRPLYMEDATDTTDLPSSFKVLMSSFPETELDSYKILTALLYTLAVESGFTWNIIDTLPLNSRCYTFDMRTVNSIKAELILSGLKADDGFIFPLFLGSVKHFSCIMYIRPWLQRFWTINLYSTQSLISFSKIVDISRYVTDDGLNLGNIKEFSIECKNELFYPLKSYFLAESAIKGASLLDLPVEILLQTMKCLTVCDFLNLCSTCHYLNDNFKELESVWKYYCEKHNFISDKSSSMTWKKHFQNRTSDNNKPKKVRRYCHTSYFY